MNEEVANMETNQKEHSEDEPQQPQPAQRLDQEVDHLNSKTITIGIKSYQIEEAELGEDGPGNERFETHDHLDLSSIPWKIYIICAILDVLGLIYMILTFVFWGLGQYSTCLLFGIFTVLLWTPGIYFTVILYKARKAQSPEEREDIISQIPI